MFSKRNQILRGIKCNWVWMSSHFLTVLHESKKWTCRAEKSVIVLLVMVFLLPCCSRRVLGRLWWVPALPWGWLSWSAVWTSVGNRLSAENRRPPRCRYPPATHSRHPPQNRSFYGIRTDNLQVCGDSRRTERTAQSCSVLAGQTFGHWDPSLIPSLGSQFLISGSYNPSFGSYVPLSSDLLHALDLLRSGPALLAAPGWTSSSSRAQRAGASGEHSSGREDGIRTTHKSRKYHGRGETKRAGKHF